MSTGHPGTRAAHDPLPVIGGTPVSTQPDAIPRRALVGSDVEFSPELRKQVLSGAITVTSRLWQRPKVEPGGIYRMSDGQIEVDSVELSGPVSASPGSLESRIPPLPDRWITESQNG